MPYTLQFGDKDTNNSQNRHRKSEKFAQNRHRKSEESAQNRHRKLYDPARKYLCLS